MEHSKLVYPAWANWIAQDADGAVWVYEVEPLQHHQGWYENELGRSQKMIVQKINPDWSDTLTKIKSIPHC